MRTPMIPVRCDSTSFSHSIILGRSRGAAAMGRRSRHSPSSIRSTTRRRWIVPGRCCTSSIVETRRHLPYSRPLVGPVEVLPSRLRRRRGAPAHKLRHPLSPLPISASSMRRLIRRASMIGAEQPLPPGAGVKLSRLSGARTNVLAPPVNTRQLSHRVTRAATADAAGRLGKRSSRQSIARD